MLISSDWRVSRAKEQLKRFRGRDQPRRTHIARGLRRNKRESRGSTKREERTRPLRKLTGKERRNFTN